MAGYIDPRDTTPTLQPVTSSPSLSSNTPSRPQPSSQLRHLKTLLTTLTKPLTTLLPPSRSHRHRQQQQQLLHHHATHLAQTYLSSNPLPAHLPAQKDLSIFCRHLLLLQNTPPPPSALTHYIPILQHRLHNLATATQYKNLLELDTHFPPCHGFDFQAWWSQRCCASTTSSSNYSDETTTTTPLSSSSSAERETRMRMKFRFCCALVWEAGIFAAAPMGEEGGGDLKPVYYLAAALAESGRSSRAIRAMVLRLVELEFGNGVPVLG
ncbi:MAG: hypothetical protein L6R36_004070 [Xanthoria steineri]|nr:MAG: hypothetical protein L6R36_004070 [Xanthoria steineri]